MNYPKNSLKFCKIEKMFCWNEKRPHVVYHYESSTNRVYKSY